MNSNFMPLQMFLSSIFFQTNVAFDIFSFNMCQNVLVITFSLMSFQKSIRLRGALDQSEGELYQFEN